MFKKLDKIIVALLTLGIICSATAFAASRGDIYYSTININPGESLTGDTRTYHGNTISINYISTVCQNTNVLECYSVNFWGQGNNLGTRYVSTDVDESWSMNGDGNYYFWFNNMQTYRIWSNHVTMQSSL